jgi:hypothetical protein
MKKFVVGLTAALAIGAMAAPSVSNAANERGGSASGHASVAHSSGGGGKSARSTGGNRGVASVQSRGIRANTSARVNTRSSNGNRWSGNNRNRNGGGYYAGYDTCWQKRLTPFGYRYINVCNDNNDIF